MISLVRNLLVQNVLKMGLRGDHLVKLRCSSKSLYVQKSDYLKTTTRNLSTVVYYEPSSPTTSIAKSQKFMSYYPDVERELREMVERYDPFGTEEHLKRVLQYNITGGKLYRGIMAVQTYELMAPKPSLTEENVKLSMYLGWCIEILQGSFLIVDDIMDESLMRRGKPSWYKVEDIGMSSINDAVLLEAAVYQILKNHFSHLDCYVKILEIFHDISFVSYLGQYLDTKTRYEDVLSFTTDQFKTIATMTVFYYTFYLPIASAMYLAGNTNQDGLRQACITLREISHFLQSRNDFLDCFGEQKNPNMIGTDIRTKKCTWLAVKCLERANEAQKAIMKENYGKNGIECIWRVKQLYEELSLPEVYENFEEETCNILEKKIQDTLQGFPIDLFMKFLTKLQKREL